MQGTTKTGFTFNINNEDMNNMELLDAICELEEGSELAISKVCNLMFNKEDKKRLYNHVRNSNGKVPIDKIGSEIIDIFQSGGKAGKNL